MKNKEANSQYKERINYIVDHHDDGRTSYTGKSINYDCVCSSWKSVEDLEKKMKVLINMWLKLGKETIDESGLEMKQVDNEEWDALDDNIDYWEIERIKRLLKRPGIRKVLKDLIAPFIERGDDYGIDVDEIIDAIQNHKQNEQD